MRSLMKQILVLAWPIALCACGNGDDTSSPAQPLAVSRSDAGSDASVTVSPSRSASSSDGGSEASSPDAGSAHCCSALVDSGPTNIIIEPCWDSDPAGNYARWTCGSSWCSNNGLSCAVGSPCLLQDIGAAGVVQDCF